MWRFNCMGFAVTVEPWFWLTSFFLGGGLRIDDGDSLRLVLIWMLVVFVSILVHELGHAVASRKFGAYAEIRLIAFGGVTLMHGGYFNRSESILVSAAGPAAGLVLGAIVLMIQRMVPIDNYFIDSAIRYLLWVNFFWTAINLLPILPMDGGQILRAVLGPDRIQVACIIGAVCAAGVAVWALSVDQLYLAILMGYFAYTNFQNNNLPGGVIRD